MTLSNTKCKAGLTLQGNVHRRNFYLRGGNDTIYIAKAIAWMQAKRNKNGQNLLFGDLVRFLSCKRFKHSHSDAGGEVTAPCKI